MVGCKTGMGGRRDCSRGAAGMVEIVGGDCRGRQGSETAGDHGDIGAVGMAGRALGMGQAGQVLVPRL